MHKDTFDNTASESFGDLLRRLRGPLSLRGLGRRTGWDFSYLGQIERGEKPGSLHLAEDCDQALDAGGALVATFQATAAPSEDTAGHTRGHHAAPWIHTLDTATATGEEGVIDRRGFLSSVVAAAVTAPLLPPQPAPAHPRVPTLAIAGPAGEWFSGVATPAFSFPAQPAGHSVLIGPDSITALPRAGGARRILIGADRAGRHFAVDSAVAAARHRQGLAEAPVRIPQALLLDEVTEGLLWALSNLEASLHADDAVIDQAASQRTGTWDLTPVTSAWLGSSACAEHLLSNLDRLGSAPAFWTRERTAEEASTWLFFAHKVAYLEATQRRYSTAADPATRTFCIPESTLGTASLHERSLLLLAMSLMESFTVAVRICTHPEYAATDGFAADSSTAIIATWVRAAQDVAMDVVSNPSALADFDDAIRHTATCNAAAGAAPTERLTAAADYLGVSWTWFTARCAELSGNTLDALLVARSRHLTVAGPKRACNFLTQLTHSSH